MADDGDLLPAVRDDSSSVLELISRAASDPSVDVAKMQSLVAMYRELAADQARREYNVALSQAQEEIQPVARTTENKQTSSWYAKLEDVDRAIRPVYIKHGFALSFNTIEPLVSGNVRVECRCSRGSHIEKYYLEAPPDTHGPKGTQVKTTIHGIGSTDTFLRRYLACSIFNVVFERMDTDGTSGPITAEDVDAILAKLEEGKVNQSRFLKYMRLPTTVGEIMALIPKADLGKALLAADELIRMEAQKNANPA